LGHLSIAEGRTEGNALEDLPHLALKGRTLDIERQVGGRVERFDPVEDLPYPYLKFVIPIAPLSLGKIGLELSDESSGGVVKGDRTNAPSGRGDQHPAQPAGLSGIARYGVRGAQGQRGGSHGGQVLAWLSHKGDQKLLTAIAQESAG
jgi:hypothetical protein